MTIDEAQAALAAAVAHRDDLQAQVRNRRLALLEQRAAELHRTAIAKLGRLQAKAKVGHAAEDAYLAIAVETGTAVEMIPEPKTELTYRLHNAHVLVTATARKVDALKAEHNQFADQLRDAESNTETAAEALHLAVGLDAAHKVTQLRAELRNAEESLVGLASISSVLNQHSDVAEALDSYAITDEQQEQRILAHAEAWTDRLTVIEDQALKPQAGTRAA